ncbi:MAG TPA: hypothetical protein VEJ63_13250 [Planctomycetota bacterium]|nr:hypothetical protein [Planctomycetota bacterium]
MLPKQLLDRVRRGAQSAALIAALGAGSALADDPVPEKAPAQADAKEPAALSKEQLELIKTTIPKLGADEFETREKASAALKALGKPAVPALQEALKEQINAEIKSRLTALIKIHTQPPPQTVDNTIPCVEKCGRG